MLVWRVVLDNGKSKNQGTSVQDPNFHGKRDINFKWKIPLGFYRLSTVARRRQCAVTTRSPRHEMHACAHVPFFPLNHSFSQCARRLRHPVRRRPSIRTMAPSQPPLARSRCASPMVPQHVPLGVARATALRNLIPTPISRRGLFAGPFHAQALHIPAVWMLALYARGGPMDCLRSWWLGECVAVRVTRACGRVRNVVRTRPPQYYHKILQTHDIWV